MYTIYSDKALNWYGYTKTRLYRHNNEGNYNMSYNIVSAPYVFNKSVELS